MAAVGTGPPVTRVAETRQVQAAVAAAVYINKDNNNNKVKRKQK